MAIVAIGAECEVRVLGILALDILALDREGLYKVKDSAGFICLGSGGCRVIIIEYVKFICPRR